MCRHSEARLALSSLGRCAVLLTVHPALAHVSPLRSFAFILLSQVSVRPLQAPRYVAETGDVVIGRVTEVRFTPFDGERAPHCRAVCRPLSLFEPAFGPLTPSLSPLFAACRYRANDGTSTSAGARYKFGCVFLVGLSVRNAFQSPTRFSFPLRHRRRSPFRGPPYSWRR